MGKRSLGLYTTLRITDHQWIALVKRGQCSFATKVELMTSPASHDVTEPLDNHDLTSRLHVQTPASAVIVYDHTENDALITMSHYG